MFFWFRFQNLLRANTKEHMLDAKVVVEGGLNWQRIFDFTQKHFSKKKNWIPKLAFSNEATKTLKPPKRVKFNWI